MEKENNKELDTFTDSTENNDAKEDAPEIEKVKDIQEELLLCEDKLQRALADYQNLERRSNIEVSQKILQKTNQLMLSFIGVYEDFIRAKSALEDELKASILSKAATLAEEDKKKKKTECFFLQEPKEHNF